MITSPTKTDDLAAPKPRATLPPDPNGAVPSGPALPSSKKVTVVKHPVAQHALTALRSKLTAPHDFRTISNQLLVMLVMEATRTLPTREESVPGPADVVVGQTLAKPVVFLTIARQSLGLAHRMADFFPDLLVGSISLGHAEGGQQSVARLHLPHAPALSDARVIIFDPIVATGSSSSRAINLIRRSGASDISLVSFVISDPGLSRVQATFPDLAVWTAAIDFKLDARRGPLPGVGDFAERLYG